VYSLQKINISLIDDSVNLVRFVHEDPIIPPYYIENITKYEISILQLYKQPYYHKRSVP
jgi:vacuolar protein sorting-associated protein 13A/C